MELAYIFKYPSTMETTTTHYEVYTNDISGREQLLLTKLFTFFSRGKAAESCPKCPITVKKEEFIGYVDYIDGLRRALLIR